MFDSTYSSHYLWVSINESEGGKRKFGQRMLFIDFKFFKIPLYACRLRAATRERFHSAYIEAILDHDQPASLESASIDV